LLFFIAIKANRLIKKSIPCLPTRAWALASAGGRYGLIPPGLDFLIKKVKIFEDFEVPFLFTRKIFIYRLR